MYKFLNTQRSRLNTKTKNNQTFQKGFHILPPSNELGKKFCANLGTFT